MFITGILQGISKIDLLDFIEYILIVLKLLGQNVIGLDNYVKSQAL